MRRYGQWCGVFMVLAALCGGVLAGGNLFVADQNLSVRVFDALATGDAAPLRVVSGTNTLFERQHPKGIAVDNDFMYVTLQTGSVASAAAIGVFPLSADGDVAPMRLIAGDNTLLSSPRGLAVDTQYVYVANLSAGSVTVYPLDADGNVAPTRRIMGAGTLMSGPNGIAVDDQYIYVANYHNDSITVYEKTAESNASPVRVIQGAQTGLSWPEGVAVNDTSIFVTDMSSPGEVKAFALTADGNVAPERTITGNNTGLFGPWGIAVDDQYLYVGNFTCLAVFRPTDDGNVAPVRLIEGNQPGILFAQGVAVKTDWGRDRPEPEHDPDALDAWRWRNPKPNGNMYYGTAYGDGRFVAVGRDGAALYSLDGETWEAANAGSNTLFSVTYADGHFTAVGSHSAVVTSPDGAVWTEESAGTPHALKSILYTGTRYVVGSGSEVLTSENGTDWTRHAIDPPTSWDCVAQGDGVILLAGWSYTNGTTVYSLNGGNTWTSQGMPGEELAPWGLAYGNGLFVMVGYDQIASEALIMTSPSGTNWTRRTVPSPDRRILRAVTFGDGVFTAAGGSGDDVLYVSSDGVTWTDKTPNLVNEEFYTVCCGGGRLVACGAGGLVEASTDAGATWTLKTPGAREYFMAVAYGAGRFVAVSASKTNYFSRNGVNWSPISQTSPRELADVVFAAGQFVGVGILGCIVTSPDGEVWTERTSGVVNWLQDVEYLEGAFYAVGIGGCVLRSFDGAAWDVLVNGGDDYEAITYGNGMFVAVGNDVFGRGFISYSANAVNWTVAVQEVPETFKGVQFGAGRFVVVGANKTLATSPDGINWTQEADLWDGALGLQ
ncbi:MAG: beta-propeller fold lactonase family protein, partial [Kiritimatiellae bacterium]|nr:beta-propeller fold lactonase family protein [Kiritimatiellia bacterium]